jgi:hypothetical protein
LAHGEPDDGLVVDAEAAAHVGSTKSQRRLAGVTPKSRSSFSSVTTFSRVARRTAKIEASSSVAMERIRSVGMSEQELQG